jgi:HPt (histidine-containing phosphotransfer) domain-containing protein
MSFRGIRFSRAFFQHDELPSRGKERPVPAEDMDMRVCAGGDKCLMKSTPVNESGQEMTQFSARRSDLNSGGCGKVLWNKTEALERLGGDEDLLRELCEMFLAESPKLLQKLREAIAEADSQEVMRAAHSLKGELGYLGAEGAVQAARELEDMGHENNLSRAAELFTLLERELASLHRGMKDPAGATS